ncbi:phage antirepressor KilAC domain-containing protein [Bacillus cytotoxicus]|uniref:phage antirepressor KilAC domain-containing protein n=1 Tax=Bacillus cytotoxicus TaxID=580165 RepID=UPI0008645A50|nr:phage antirepressor KilAC domain-containing protein [Bacillus cytotoxicus]MDH2858870.1 phage antirepressor KilAC domain-containing protein [Bacillus cytotoxicus]MDH2871353.1 phage antirepressor KilAC domain-containing protein [Bacillus cytotoxicus]MDH2874858.1 phage antirepressor KilAC domain-containing protein [Bacillus cytotoxicus]MDH2919768.1 phage antirepressor KilAC domain-containing protein [Bacillus cytotoxicus]QTR81425.1 phage antirepressor KilAC domain-containing protein [Bacillus 
MSQLQVFKHKEFGALEVIQLNGKEMFNLENAAWSLGYTKVAKGKTYLRKDRIEKVIQKAAISVVVHRGQPYITEDGLYELIFESETQKAKEFRKWVTSEVLPSIRKHGAYMTDQALEKAVTDPDFMIGLLTNLKEEKAKRLEAERKVLQQQPLVTFAEACMQSDQSLKVSEVAKLATKQGVKIGQRRLFEKLREWELMFKRSTEPTQKAVEKGYFEVAQGVKRKPNGEAFTWTTTYVTPVGQSYIISRLKEEQQNKAM